MTEFLSKIDSGHLIAIVAIVGGLFCGTVLIIAEFWRRMYKAGLEARLKENMLDRGMPAEEIKLVLEAGSEGAKEE